MMVFAVLLQFVWMVVTLIISVAVLYLLLINRMIDNGAKIVNLQHYGKTDQSCALNTALAFALYGPTVYTEQSARR